MAKSITPVNITTETFGVLYTRLNEVINAISTEVVTANSSANGALTVGNGYVQGIFGANVLYAVSELRGGNGASSGNLVVSSNANFTSNINAIQVLLGNSTNYSLITDDEFVFTSPSSNGYLSASELVLQTTNGIIELNSDGLLVLDLTANALFSANRVELEDATDKLILTPAGFDINDYIKVVNNEIRIGNSTVFSVVNSTSIAVDQVISSSTLNVAGFHIGNSTANVTVNSSVIALGDSQVFANQTHISIGKGANNILIFQDGINVNNNIVITKQGISVNTVNITNTGLSVGNSSVNSTTISADVIQIKQNIDAQQIMLGNSASNSVINGNGVVTGNLVFLTQTNLTVGNSTVNTSTVIADNVTVRGSLNIPQLSMGNTTINVIANSSTIVVGNTVHLTQTRLTVGNSAINVSSNSTILSISTPAANAFVNSTSINLVNSSVNFSIVKPTAAQVTAGNFYLSSNGWAQVEIPDLGISNLAITTTGTSAQLFDSFEKSNIRSVEYTISITNNSANGYQTQKLLTYHYNGDIDLTEYAILMSNGSLGTFTANVNTSHGRIYFTPTAANTTLKYFRFAVNA